MARRTRRSALVLLACVTSWIAACAGTTSPHASGGDWRGGSPRWRTIYAMNHFSTDVVLYPELSGTMIWERIGRVPAHTSRKMRVPASYLDRDFRVVVCLSSARPDGTTCTRTNRYLRNDPAPRLIIRPYSRLYAELIGED